MTIKLVAERAKPIACKCKNKAPAETTGGQSMRVPANSKPPGDQREGYILAEVTVNKVRAHLNNGRRYPTMFRGQEWYVHADDVANYPHWWKAVEVAEPEPEPEPV